MEPPPLALLDRVLTNAGVLDRRGVAMKKRKIDSLEVGTMGLGCMGMNDFYGTQNEGARGEAEAIATIHRAIELGVIMLDTADIYAMGDNEEFVGRAIRGKRDQVVLATKFGILRKKEDPTFRGANTQPDYVQAACEASLKRLGVDVIDLYYIHRLDGETPVEETMLALSILVREGKVRAIGLSNVSADNLRRAHEIHSVAAVQNEHSLWSREPEDELLPTCRALGIGFVPYAPLGRGFLSGDITKPEDFGPGDVRGTLPRFQGDNFAGNLALVDRVNAMAAEKGCTPSQLALAWVLAHGEDIVPIPGTKRRKP